MGSQNARFIFPCKTREALSVNGSADAYRAGFLGREENDVREEY